MNDVPSVFIVDRNRQLGARLARLVERRGGRPSVFTSAKEFAKAYRATRPSCLVLNIKMRGFRSLEFQQGLSKSVWNVPVIFISEHADVATSVRAMKQGAMDFLLKPIKEAEFLEAIRKALQRARKLREDMAMATQVHQKLASLTMREREVLLLVVSGMLNKQIAATLGTSEKTIKVHRHRVMEKMGVQSLAQLARLAERAQLPIPKLASYASSSEYSSEAIHLAARSLDLGKSALTGRATERFRQWASNPAPG